MYNRIFFNYLILYHQLGFTTYTPSITNQSNEGQVAKL
jgi:hypothetical protein